MKINNIAIGTVFVLGLSFLSTPAFAEELAEEAPVVEEAPIVEEPVVEPQVRDDREGYTQEEVFVAPEIPTENPTPEYTPPAEASEGVGGWAVVNPDTGKVHGVIVGTIDTYNANNGVIGSNYMGCHSQCLLRFQTRATSDGNVAGWHGDNVTYDGDSNKTFSIKSNPDSNTTRVETLVPEQTARDEAGMNLGTGITNIKTNSRIESGQKSVEIESNRDGTEDSEGDVSILFPEWNQERKLFNYLSEQSAVDEIRSDVETELFNDGFVVETETTDPETLEVITESSIDEENDFVKTIRTLAESVVSFFGRIFGITPTPEPQAEETVVEELIEETATDDYTIIGIEPEEVPEPIEDITEEELVLQ